MKKKKLTNKEISEAIGGLSINDQILRKEILEVKQILSLYLECVKHTDKFSKFVKAKTEEFEKQQQPKNKKGA